MTEIKLPPRPVSQYTDTPDVAVSKSIHKLSEHASDKGKTLEMTSTISESDVPRMALMLSLAQDRDLDLEWLGAYTYAELALSKSIPVKRGGILSEQIVAISKSPDMLMNNEGGIIGGLKRRLQR